MKKYLLSTAAAVTFLSMGPALAADLPVKAAPVVCASCNWNGYYFGINFGGSIGQNGSNDSISLNPAGTPSTAAPGVINPISSTGYSQAPTGWLGGGQIGANWMVGHLVFGVEADWQWTGQRDTLQVANFLASSVVVAPASYGYTDEQTIKWLATARGRIGWASGYTLAYVTGGVAWGRVDSSYTFQANGAGTFASAPGAASFNTTKTGFVLGSGVETALGWAGANQWSAKIEYLYVDLGTVTNSFTVQQGGPASNYTVTSSSHIRDHIIRLGLNYRFGGERWAPPPPPTPGPCVTCNWTGFYVGLNEATGLARNRSHNSDSLIPPTANTGNVTNPIMDVGFTHSPIGQMGGVTAGFNFQNGKIVWGIEADWDLARQRDTFANENFVASTVVVAPTVLTLVDEQKINWLATARGRVGWTDNCFLWYVTGGAAFGRVESNYTFLANQTIGGGVLSTNLATAGFSSTKTGWTVGGGVESTLGWLNLSDRWTTKFEYLYVDLGSITNTFAVPVTPGTGAHTVTSTSDIRDHVFKFGINYRLGG